MWYIPTRFNTSTKMEEVKIPSRTDILCGRGMIHSSHSGNQFFQGIVRKHVSEYAKAPSRIRKTAIVVSALEEIAGERGARFLRLEKSKGIWYPLTAAEIHEKVRHAMRDLSISTGIALESEKGAGKRRSTFVVQQQKQKQMSVKNRKMESMTVPHGEHPTKRFQDPPIHLSVNNMIIPYMLPATMSTSSTTLTGPTRPSSCHHTSTTLPNADSSASFSVVRKRRGGCIVCNSHSSQLIDTVSTPTVSDRVELNPNNNGERLFAGKEQELLRCLPPQSCRSNDNSTSWWTGKLVPIPLASISDTTTTLSNNSTMSEDLLSARIKSMSDCLFVNEDEGFGEGEEKKGVDDSTFISSALSRRELDGIR